MEASERLQALCSNEDGKITRYPESLRTLHNGVEHYFVEVTSKEGIQYGLQAYGNEAVELYKQTMRAVGKDT